MSEKPKSVYVTGFRTFGKKEGSPEFVLGSLIITIDDFVEFITTGEGSQYLSKYAGKDQISLNILQGREGVINFTVNTFKKSTPSAGTEHTRENIGNIEDPNLPF